MRPNLVTNYKKYLTAVLAERVSPPSTNLCFAWGSNTYYLFVGLETRSPRNVRVRYIWRKNRNCRRRNFTEASRTGEMQYDMIKQG